MAQKQCRCLERQCFCLPPQMGYMSEPSIAICLPASPRLSDSVIEEMETDAWACSICMWLVWDTYLRHNEKLSMRYAELHHTISSTLLPRANCPRRLSSS